MHYQDLRFHPLSINLSLRLLKEGLLLDNILLMQKMIRCYHRNELPSWRAIKIDLMKVYDFVCWALLFDVMTSMEFLDMRWVRQCATTARFSIVINGELEEGHFKPLRGKEV